ncbi:MAG: hypothetical protein LN588_05900 [Rickettsia endosymbiont of Bryobia graminum]|nr:hypothetical protein [Rickettsia endosymbiont of Bryobia graminum]
MYLKSFLKRSFFFFMSDITKMFRINQNISVTKQSEANLAEYFIEIEKDINSAFQEIKREYER